MNIRLAGIVNDSIVDGPGIRLTVFTQGCPHGCAGCHNPQTHDPLGGYDTDTQEIITLLDRNPLLDGITLSGGEPFLQPKAASCLAKAAQERGLTVWTYTGFLWEELISSKDPDVLDLLHHTTVLVDGKFESSQKDWQLRFCGSANQRIIDVKESLLDHKIILYPINDI